MSGERAELLARLRGGLDPDGYGARAIGRLVHNPRCLRLAALTIAGISPDTALHRAYGERPREGISPIALFSGNQFERDLTENGAARLLALYRAHGRLGPAESRVAIVRDTDGPRRRTYTDRLLALKLRGDPRAPNLIIKPRLDLPFADMLLEIEPDALIAGEQERFYRVVEIKAYSDFGPGKTDPDNVKRTLHQAAVGAVALRHAAVRLDAADAASLVPDLADLVFRYRGTRAPSLNWMSIRRELAAIEGVVERAPAMFSEALEIVQDLGSHPTLLDRYVLEAIPNNYRADCRRFCPLALPCKQAAIETGDLIVLGTAAREKLAAAGSIPRALALMNGCDAPPRTPDERVLQGELQEAETLYREAVGSG